MEAVSRPSSSGNISTHHFAVWLSLYSTLQEVSYSSSSHTPVDRAGGVKKWMPYFCDSLVIWKYLLLLMQVISTLLWLGQKGRVYHCWISNIAVLSSSTCILITPPSHLNQQFSTHDNNVVLATANLLENTTARLILSVAHFHDYHVSSAVLLILRAL